MKNWLYVLFVVILISSCGGKRTSDKNGKSSYNYHLTESGKMKIFDLDEETRYNAFFLYQFADNQGKEYLSFLNYRTNQILFYDFETASFLFKTEMPMEGVNGVNLMSGYYISGFDNMYISSYIIPGLIKIDTTATIVQTIKYGTTGEGYNVVPSYAPASHPFIPPVFIDGKVYITQMAADHVYPASQTPVSVAIDTLTHASEGLPFTFADALAEEHYSRFGESRFSRTFNGKEFVYSFYANPHIFVTSVNHQNIREINAKSRYIDEIKQETPPQDPNQGAKRSLEAPCYGDLIYDKYREVYYRFVYPETELEPNKQYLGKALYGRKRFSVIILDKEFNVIGETLFPEAVYNSYVFFVHKDGLYISKDYQINNEQSEEQLTFELFTLENKTK